MMATLKLARPEVYRLPVLKTAIGKKFYSSCKNIIGKNFHSPYRNVRGRCFRHSFRSSSDEYVTGLRPVAVSCRRHFTPMTPQEEEEEKQRVASLSDFQKDQELRKLNREIAKLEILKGINTGERYTWTGRYKALARDYGVPLFIWYWACWGTTAVVCYGLIEVGGVDAMAIVAKLDARTGWDLTSKIDPQLGQIGLALVLNEIIEPFRLPAVIVTVKPVMDRFFPPKY